MIAKNAAPTLQLRITPREAKGDINVNFGSKAIIASVAATILVLIVVIAPGFAQSRPAGDTRTPTEQRPLMADHVFKNVQLLKGISVKEFMETMGFFAAATNKTCTTCHGDESGGSWERYADDPPQKQTARKMMLMVDALNRTYFGGKREVTCYSCHRNAERPKITPVLAEQYGTPAPEDPDEITQQAPGAPSADAVLDKYIQAVGGPEKVSKLLSIAAKGNYEGYDEPRSPVEIYAKAPGQSYQLVRGSSGDSAWVDDGRSAWVAQSDPNVSPVPLMELTAGDLDGAHLESALYFPARIRQLLANLRVGLPVTGVTSILANDVGVGVDDRELTVVQGTTAAGNNVKLYFDPKSGLLVRMVRYTSLPVGFIPTEIDYADYRDVSGIKVPFRVTKTWVDGRSVTELSSIQLNVPIDGAKFAKPTLPAAAKSVMAR